MLDINKTRIELHYDIFSSFTFDSKFEFLFLTKLQGRVVVWTFSYKFLIIASRWNTHPYPLALRSANKLMFLFRMTHYLVRKQIHIQCGLTWLVGWFIKKKKKSNLLCFHTNKHLIRSKVSFSSVLSLENYTDLHLVFCVMNIFQRLQW